MFNHHVIARRHGLGALDLQLNKSVYNVGEAPFYTVIGAAANNPLLWTSTKNGLTTGEQAADYGQRTDAAGAWSGAGSQFTADQVGSWTKTATVGSESDTAPFQVLPTGGSTGSGSGVVYVPVPTANKPADTINLLGYELPSYAVYIAIALGVWILFGKK